MATKKRMKEYLASQNIHDVESIDFAESFDDLGPTVRAWHVKAKERDWWVLEGDGVPMNVYPQEFVRLSADEAYSFHMGLMMRMGPPEECDCPACKAGGTSHLGTSAGAVAAARHPRRAGRAR